MSEGIQKRVQPDLVQEIEAYSGGSFSEKMVKWKNDVDTTSQIVEKTEQAIQDVVEGNVHESEEELRERIDELRSQRQDTLSKEDVREAVEEALPSRIYQ